MNAKFLIAISLVNASLSAICQEQDTSYVPDFLDSRFTAAVYVSERSEVRHIVAANSAGYRESPYYFIDHGLIKGVRYKYYINCSRTLVVGVPIEFPGTMYSISICSYTPQGGYASQEYIESMQREADCFPCD